MNIKFYSYFYKKSNSTLLPDNNIISFTFDCKLLEGTSIINPVVVLESTSAIRPDIYTFTYAYIEQFNRYYFVNNIISNNNLWTITMSVDVLATYRADIRGSRQYVLRSASTSDDDIVDKFYITKPYTTSSRTAISTYSYGNVSRYVGTYSEQVEGQVFYFNYDGRVASYAVCFGVIGSNGVGANYYVATEDNFIAFMTNVFALVPSDMGNLADGLKKTLLDLNQYIISVVRIPVMPHTNNLGVHKTSIKLGSYSVACDCYSIIPGLHYEEYWLLNDLPLPQHPKISTHAYYGMPPFTTYVLDFLPVGSIPLDAAKLYGKTSINVKWRIDYISGLAWFKVGYFEGINFITLTTDIAQVGIPIPLSQLKVDTATGIGLSIANVLSDAFKSFGSNNSSSGTLNNIASNIGRNVGQSARDLISGIGRILKGDTRKMIPASESGTGLIGQGDSIIGNFVDMNSNVLDQIIDYAGSILGDVYTKGSTGSYLNIIAGVPQVRAFFIDQAEEDNTRNGRPLHQIKLLSTLSGFCICQNASLDFTHSIAPLPVESSGVISLLNRGIYLE